MENQILAELASETVNVGAYHPTFLSFLTRRELMEASREMNPADPLQYLKAQHAAVAVRATVKYRAKQATKVEKTFL